MRHAKRVHTEGEVWGSPSTHPERAGRVREVMRRRSRGMACPQVSPLSNQVDAGSVFSAHAESFLSDDESVNNESKK